MTGRIAWCGSPLALHGARVAAAAWLVYGDEWRYVASRSGVAAWALTLAAAGHDAGKALPCLQAAASSACSRRGRPSFRFHEYASAYAIAALAAAAPPEEYRSLAAAALAVLLHHHGMEGRLEDPDVVAPLAPGAGGSCGSLGSEAVRGLRSMLEALAEACEAAARMPGVAEPCPRGLAVWAPPALAARAGFTSTLRGVVQAAARDRRLYAAVLTATAAVSVADTIAAGLEREGRIGGYALRILAEKGLDPRLVTSTLSQARP